MKPKTMWAVENEHRTLVGYSGCVPLKDEALILFHTRKSAKLECDFLTGLAPTRYWEPVKVEIRRLEK